VQPSSTVENNCVFSVVFFAHRVDVSLSLQVIPLVIVHEQDSYVWKGHDPLTVKVEGVQFAGGFQPTCVVQVEPPVMCTALTVNGDWELLVPPIV